MSIAYDDMVKRLNFGLPDRLGKALDVAGVSSGEMAEELGVSRNTISNYINGKTPVKRLVILQWAAKTGVPFEWIESGSFPEGSNPAPTTGSPERITERLLASGNVAHVDFTRRTVEAA